MKKCLNIGSGAFPMKSTKEEEWVNLDKNYYPGVDVFKDCSRGLPFNENTFDYVLMGDLIEHLTGEEIESTFMDLYRVCKHGALIEIRTPYYQHPSSWGDFTHKQHLSEWIWEQMQCKTVILPPEKKFIRWRFNVGNIKVENGRMTVIYVVHKKGKYIPTKVEFNKVKKIEDEHIG